MIGLRSGANIDVSNHPEVISDLMAIAELDYNPDVPATPEPDREA